jgi:predicted ABC-type ATPase
VEKKIGKPATKAKNKYNAQNYDNIRLVVPKGRKLEISSVAETAGDSLNAFIGKAIDERMEMRGFLNAKTYTIIGGINGVGKSSFTGVMKSINKFLGVVVDVDKIVAFNKVFPIEGDKIAHRFVQECLEEGIGFSQETTLAGSKAEATALRAKELGYYIRLYYIGLNTPEECIKRISNRVLRGGHAIGEVDVHHRFAERWKALYKILPLCDEAIFFDNDNGFVEVAEYIDGALELKGEYQPQWVVEFAAYWKRYGK